MLESLAAPDASLPLAGIRVLDLTRVLAGPFATCILGDLGAEVIKIEGHDGGDHVRSLPPFYPGEVSHYFLAMNRNKRSMCVDLKSDEGRAIILELASKSDVVIENFRPGVMERLGLGFDALRASKPDIILCSISGFGASGPMKSLPSFDLVTQARSGVMSITGNSDGPPMRLGLPMGDLGGGLWGVIGILAALNRRQTNADPQHLDISLLEGLASMLGYLGQLALMQGKSPGRVGNSHHTIVPYGVFDVADGHLVLALHMGSFWRCFCRTVGREDLIADPRFSTTSNRYANREVLLEILDPILKGKTRTEWVKLLEDADVPHAPILDVVEALDQPQFKARGAIGIMRHPTAGDVPIVRTPIVYTNQERPDVRPSPLLGEHTREICRNLLGWDDKRISALHQAGVLASPCAPAVEEQE